MTAYADTCNRIYTPRGTVAHLSYPGWLGGNPLCPALEPRGGWLGTGRQDEYDRAASLPLCSRCVKLAAERDPTPPDCAAQAARTGIPCPPGMPDSPPPPGPHPPGSGGGGPDAAPAEESARLSGGGSSPGPSGSGGRAARGTGDPEPGRGAERPPRPGQGQAPVAAVPDEKPASGPAAVTGLSGEEFLARWKAERSAHNHRKRAGRTRRAPKQLGPGMIRRLPPESGGAA